jgi:hypothetical protein
MAPYRNSPPPDWAGWSDDSLYYPRSDPLSGGDDPGEDYGELTTPQLSPPPRSTTPFGQFLPSLLDAVARRPQPVPPGQFLASIGVHLPPPQSVLAMRRYDPPPPPLVPLEPAADYTTLTVPEPMVGPQSGVRVAGSSTTPARVPAELAPTGGDGLYLNSTGGFNGVAYSMLGAPVDALTRALNFGIDGINYASGADIPPIRDPFLGSRSIARGLTHLGVPDPESVRAATTAEKIARGAGEGAAYMAAPSAMVRGGAALAGRELPGLAQAVFGRAGSARELGREAAIGAAAGGTGMAAHELAPEAWKPTAGLVGGVLGGVAAAGAMAPGTVGQVGRTLAGARVAADDAVRTAAVVGPKASPAPPLGRIDYSRGFDDDLVNFMPGAKLKEGVLDADLKLISYHADTPLGAGRSAKWWTTPDAGNSFFTTNEMRQVLALPVEWGPRDAVSHLTIPKGETIKAYVGKAAKQEENGVVYRGGGPQFRLKYYDPTWPLVQRRIP